MKKTKKLVLYGGTFNPPHKGHLKLAKSALKSLNCDKLIFVPSGNPPHKDNVFIENKFHRFKMVELLTQNCKKFSVSDFEIKSDKKSFTVNTLKNFLCENKPDELYFVIGLDSFFDLEKWYMPELIFKNCILAVAFRDGFDLNEFFAREKYYKEKYNAKIVRIKMPTIKISSSEIRKRIKKGKSVLRFIPYKIYKYIKDNRLYKEQK